MTTYYGRVWSNGFYNFTFMPIKKTIVGSYDTITFLKQNSPGGLAFNKISLGMT